MDCTDIFTNTPTLAFAHVIHLRPNALLVRKSYSLIPDLHFETLMHYDHSRLL